MNMKFNQRSQKKDHFSCFSQTKDFRKTPVEKRGYFHSSLLGCLQGIPLQIPTRIRSIPRALLSLIWWRSVYQWGRKHRFCLKSIERGKGLLGEKGGKKNKIKPKEWK